MKWYKQNYVNRRDWLIENTSLLGLDSNEFMICMVIDYMNQFNETITMDSLKNKTGLDMKILEEGIESLIGKRYLSITASAKGAVFSLDEMYDTDIAKEISILDRDLYQMFEMEFGRTLNHHEMEKISEWNRVIDQRIIKLALLEASAHRVLKIEYIDKILSNWQERGYTYEQIATGEIYEGKANTRSNS